MRKIIQRLLHPKVYKQGQQSEGKTFHGSHEYLMENERLLLEERISLFDGKTNPICCFSIDDLEQITKGFSQVLPGLYDGVIDGKRVLVRVVGDWHRGRIALREIAVNAQMNTHNNVLKILGCCLATRSPILIHERVDCACLSDRILGDATLGNQQLVWKDRLRIAWEISYAMAYLHTAFSRPIILRNLKPDNVCLDHDNVAKLSDFSCCISIPKGKKYLLGEPIVGRYGYIAPEYLKCGILAECSDVYSFGMLFLVLLSGRPIWSHVMVEDDNWSLQEKVREELKNKQICEIVDRTIISQNLNLQQQLEGSVDIIFRCTNIDHESRPTMVDVASELKNIVTSDE